MRMKIMGAAFFGALLAAGGASAATCTIMSQGTVLEITVAGTAQCVSGQNDTNFIDSSTEFFGLTGWILAEKSDGPKGDHELTFGTLPVTGDKSGWWEILNPGNYENVFLTLKAGKGFGAFLLTPEAVMAGDWSSTKGLSHASIYYQGEPGAAPVPLPASGFLLVGALGALALRRRKRA